MSSERSVKSSGAAGGIWFAVGSVVVVALFATMVSAHRFIGDDAFIVFRYAHNLVDGHGLVFNPGERVEGYTSLTWALAMAAVIAAGGSPEWWSQALGVLSGLGVLAAVWVYGVRRYGSSSAWALLPALVLAVNRTFAAWSTGGLETQLFALLVTLTSLSFLADQAAGRLRPRTAALLALAALTRPEGLLFAMLLAPVVALSWIRRSASTAEVVRWTALVGVPVAVHFVWRQAWYGYPLPNTFYAKVSGAWFEQGWTWLGLCAQAHHLGVLAVIVGLSLVVRPSRDRAMFCWLSAGYLTYTWVVGGDRFEFRFLVPVAPLLALMVTDALAALERAVSGAVDRRTRIVAGAAAAVLVVYASSRSTWWLPDRQLPAGIQRIDQIADFAAQRQEEGRALHRLIEAGALPADTLIAVTGAGALPYISGLPTVDIHGLNDVHVGHQPLEQRGVVGHEKVATWEYLQQRGVVLVDVCNRLALDGARGCPPAESLPPLLYSAPVHCAARADTVLVFATTRSIAELEHTLAEFSLVY